MLLVLSGVLAACQTATPVQDAETVETTSIIVEAPGGDSIDLDGQVVQGTIVISIPAEGWMKDVRFFLNGVLTETLTSAPFQLTIDTTALDDGAHTVGVEARMANNRVRISTSVDFTVANAAARQPDEVGDPEPAELDEKDAPLPFSLRGNPNFSREHLSPAQRTWYDRLWYDIANPGDLDPMALAARDDLYYYARTLHTYVQSLLTAFRMTGDLALLDVIDSITERMREELRDGWRDTLDGTNGTTDGYLNWVYRYGNSTLYQGKDTHQLNEMKTHALIATVAYVLELNRDLRSPSGRDYGAHADFWLDYLVNHFEAKWRERRGVPEGFPIMTRPHTHTYYSWLKWHYYMGKLTGDPSYHDEAIRMADVLWDEIRTVTTPSGRAYVWARSVLSEGGTAAYLHPTVYAGYVYGDIIEFHLEGFHSWASTANMHRFARTFTELIINTPDPVKDGFSSDIGGGQAQAGYESDPSWSDMHINRYRHNSYALISAWDTTTRLTTVSQEIQHTLRSEDTTNLAAGLFIASKIVQP